MSTPPPTPQMPQPTGMLGAAARARLDADHIDAVAATMLNLVAEVVSLANRVAALESAASAHGAVVVDAGDIVRRVLAPLAAQQPAQPS
jgi:hypothetical protein